MKDKSDYRKALGSFATGVTIVTTASNGAYFGFTANSFTSVSLEPPLILFCVKKDATFVQAIEISKRFGINILSIAQEEISNKFANPSILNNERFQGTDIEISSLGCPIVKDCLAYLDCEQVKVTEEGDHLIIIGRVESFSYNSQEKPLLYFGGGYGSLSEPK